ncbi:hypothetical protein Taro_014593 [Colocasia esculenta]|uniref:Uncharacterized protein n=1 Tax=Colocasia esculenta TaxID=4460 RepID=A0A843UJK0_COLES|nr:hypothetical protein [Colocasia esculenta]
MTSNKSRVGKERRHHTGTNYCLIRPVSNPDKTTQEQPLSLAVTDERSNCHSTRTRFWRKVTLASTLGRLSGVSVQTWTATLIPASSDMDANFSDLHALQSQKIGEQGIVGDTTPLEETVETDSERGD